MIRVLICDDQAVVCEGLNAILSTAAGIEVAGLANNGAQALDQVQRLQPDVVLMDLKMPVMNGIQATRAIRERFPQVRILVLTTYDLDEWVFDAIHSGASGYLLKDTPRDELISAIRGTADGKTYVDPDVAGKLFQRISAQSPRLDTQLVNMLSDRELDVLTLLAHGLTNPEIARQLFLSEGTVRNYISSILDKLNVSDRTQAALLALRAGIGGQEPSEKLGSV
ncbi:MAG TPA: response regulator transcription factor [Anaerolineaceae bacterium]